MKRAHVVLGAAGLCAVLLGVFGLTKLVGGDPEPSASVAASAKPRGCPAGSKAGWQALADEVDAPVYCPTWLPEPLDGSMDGPTFNGRFVNAKREYLVSWAWMESSPTGVTEVHVNLRGYPGQTAIPVCEDTLTVNGKTVHPKLPCFSDERGRKRAGSETVTVYTANQGVDLWHVLYAWRHRGTLYTLSEHVAPPYTHATVVKNLDRMMRGLVVMRPAA